MWAMHSDKGKWWLHAVHYYLRTQLTPHWVHDVVATLNQRDFDYDACFTPQTTYNL